MIGLIASWTGSGLDAVCELTFFGFSGRGDLDSETGTVGASLSSVATRTAFVYTFGVLFVIDFTAVVLIFAFFISGAPSVDIESIRGILIYLSSPKIFFPLLASNALIHDAYILK